MSIWRINTKIWAVTYSRVSQPLPSLVVNYPTLIRNSYRKYSISLVVNNLKLAWMGDYSSLKLTVDEFLKLDGEWASRGGERKVFYCNGLPLLTWFKKKKVIQFNEYGKSIKQKLLGTLFDQNEAKVYLPECCCREVLSDLEGFKLDITIAESQQEKAY